MLTNVDQAFFRRTDARPGTPRQPQPGRGIAIDVYVGGVPAQRAQQLRRVMAHAGLRFPGRRAIEYDAHALVPFRWPPQPALASRRERIDLAAGQSPIELQCLGGAALPGEL